MLNPLIMSELARARTEDLRREAARVAGGRGRRRPRPLSGLLAVMRRVLSPANTWARARREVAR